MQQNSQVPYQGMVFTQQQPSQPITVQQVRTHSSEISSYPKRSARIFGYLELLIGISCIVLEAIYLGAFSKDRACIFPLGAGLWTGLLHLLTGIFGVLTAKEANRCRVITFMVFAIISCVAAVVGGITAFSANLVIQSDSGRWEPTTTRPTFGLSNYTNVYYEHWYCRYEQGSHMPQLLLCICQGSQFCLALASSIICCRAVCCGSTQGAVLTPAQVAQPIAAPSYYYPVQQQPVSQGMQPGGYPMQPQPLQGGGYYFPNQPPLGAQSSYQPLQSTEHPMATAPPAYEEITKS